MAKRILAIEDDGLILELYRVLLQDAGYQVHSSKTVIEDMREIERLLPSLVILDLRIGGNLRSLDFIHKMRAYGPTLPIPIIVCTAAIQEVKKQEEVLLQENIPIIYKPFDVDELLTTIQTKLSF
jgi:DNA-binding response OmpR family regulator